MKKSYLLIACLLAIFSILLSFMLFVGLVLGILGLLIIKKHYSNANKTTLSKIITFFLFFGVIISTYFFITEMYVLIIERNSISLFERTGEITGYWIGLLIGIITEVSSNK